MCLIHNSEGILVDKRHGGSWVTSHHDSKIAGTFAQQLGWVFVGPCHPSAHGPPAWRKYHEKYHGNTEAKKGWRRILHKEIVMNQLRRHHTEGASNWNSQVQVLHLLGWLTSQPTTRLKKAWQLEAAKRAKLKATKWPSSYVAIHHDPNEAGKTKLDETEWINWMKL